MLRPLVQWNQGTIGLKREEEFAKLKRRKRYPGLQTADRVPSMVRKTLQEVVDVQYRPPLKKKIVIPCKCPFSFIACFFPFLFNSSLLAFLIKRLFFNVTNLYGVSFISLVKLRKYNLQVKTWKKCYMKFLLQIIYHKNKYKS